MGFDISDLKVGRAPSACQSKQAAQKKRGTLIRAMALGRRRAALVARPCPWLADSGMLQAKQASCVEQ
jgi:hypothetical protein